MCDGLSVRTIVQILLQIIVQILLQILGLYEVCGDRSAGIPKLQSGRDGAACMMDGSVGMQLFTCVLRFKIFSTY